jgi:hypothetical protein
MDFSGQSRTRGSRRFAVDHQGRLRNRLLLLLLASLAALLAGFAPAASQAAITSLGSPLSVPATLNTAENLNYEGTNNTTPTGTVHTFHFGVDSALWNVSLASGVAGAPEAGQALKVDLEGCAQQAAGGPSPSTQIHFQALSPLPGGGATVKLSSQPFDIPVCGQGGASGSTVSSYVPTNLCLGPGDYVGFNDNGGYVENFYRSGVPYQVMGAMNGSTFDSFLRHNGTGDNAILSSGDRTAMDGFASNPNQELMLRVTFGTGVDAVKTCGGTPGGPTGPSAPAGPIGIGAQTDGVNHAGVVAVAFFCKQPAGCTGVASLSATGNVAALKSGGKHSGYGQSHFSVKGKTTAHVKIRVTAHLIKLLHKHRGGVAAKLTIVVGGETVSQTIRLKIF